MSVLGSLEKAAEKTGFIREWFNEKNVPTDARNITVVPFFGDMRSLFVLSSLLFKRFCEEEKGSQYVILCSWPGFSSLFPYVGEYWGLKDAATFKRMYADASQFRNKGESASEFYRNLHTYFFEDLVIPYEHFRQVYNRGITNQFWNKYHHVRRSLPGVASSVVLGNEVNKDIALRGGYKVFVLPSTHLQSWHNGDVRHIHLITKDFWVYLLKRLVEEKFVPVVYWGPLAHDVSPELGSSCVYLKDGDFGHILTAMRATGCVLDLFTGTSRLALAARCPFLMMDERARYSALKEYEIDDLCGSRVPKQYIFSFPTIIENGTPESWEVEVVSGIVSRLNSFLPGLNRDDWPSTGEVTEIVLYETVRKKKAKKIGTRLLKVPKI
jgi:hypothetical protein